MRYSMLIFAIRVTTLELIMFGGSRHCVSAFAARRDTTNIKDGIKRDIESRYRVINYYIPETHPLFAYCALDWMLDQSEDDELQELSETLMKPMVPVVVKYLGEDPRHLLRDEI